MLYERRVFIDEASLKRRSKIGAESNQGIAPFMLLLLFVFAGIV